MNIKNQITMRRYTYALIIITSLILSTSIISNASAYVIDHNNHSVWVKGNYGKLEATPHTITQSGWVYFNITPYQDIENIDMVWGFNTSEVKPRKAEFYKPHWINWTTHHEKFFRNVSKIELSTDDCCSGNSYNTYKRKVTYQTGYDNVTNESITTTETVCFDSYTHNGTNYTAYWTTHHSRLEKWIDVSNKFRSVNYNYDNKTRWWYVTNFVVESYKTYTGRVWIDVPVTLEGISGKYDFAVKRSSDSLHDAIRNHRFYLLDPWFNSSWSTKRNLHIHWNIELNNPVEDGYIYNSTTTSYQRTAGSSKIVSGVINTSKYQIYRGYIEWDVSNIPDDAIITDVKFKYHGYSNDGDAHITQMICKPSGSSDQDVYDDVGNGTVYVDQDGFPEVGTEKEIDLGSNAISDLQNALSSDWFAIGIQGDTKIINNRYSEIYSEDYSDANPKPTLCIEYTGSSLNYYQMNLNLSYSDIPEAQPDFGDIRFVNISDGASLPYWIENKVNGSWCSVWVNITSLHAGWNNDTIALYYGKSDALDDGDIGETFVFGDDFEDGTLNKWDTVGSPTTSVVEDEGSNVVSIKGHDYDNFIVNKIGTFNNFVLDAKVKMTVDDHYLCAPYFLPRYTDANNKYLLLLSGESENYMYLRRYEGGTKYIDTPYTFDYTVQYYNFSAIFNGDKIDAWLDDTHLIDYTDEGTGITSGKIGLGNLRDGNIAYYDNVRVSKYTANPPTYVLGGVESYTPPITPPSKPSFTEIDLIDQLHHEYTHIECVTMRIPIYTGLNYISIPLYQYNTSLATLFDDHPVNNDTIKKYINGTWNTSTYNNSTWVNASDIEPIEPCVGYEYNRTGDNFTLNVSGYMKYNITIYTNYKNRVGTNIIRPMRSDKDD